MPLQPLIRSGGTIDDDSVDSDVEANMEGVDEGHENRVQRPAKQQEHIHGSPPEDLDNSRGDWDPGRSKDSVTRGRSILLLR